MKVRITKLSRLPITITGRSGKYEAPSPSPHIVFGYLKKPPQLGKPFSVALTGTKLEFFRVDRINSLHKNGSTFMADNNWYEVSEIQS